MRTIISTLAMYITIKTIDVNYLITNLLHVENQLLSLPSESMLTVVREVKLVSIPKVFALSVYGMLSMWDAMSLQCEWSLAERSPGSRYDVPHMTHSLHSPCRQSCHTAFIPLDATHIMDPGCTLQEAVPPLWTVFHCTNNYSLTARDLKLKDLLKVYQPSPSMSPGKDCSGAASGISCSVIPT